MRRIPLACVDLKGKGHIYNLVLTRLSDVTASSELIEEPDNAFWPIDKEWLDALEQAFQTSSIAPFTVLWRIEMLPPDTAEWLPQTDRSSGGAAAVAFWLMAREFPQDSKTLVVARHSCGRLEPVDREAANAKLKAAAAAGIRTVIAAGEQHWTPVSNIELHRVDGVHDAALLATPVNKIFDWIEQVSIEFESRQVAAYPGGFVPSLIPFEVAERNENRDERDPVPWASVRDSQDRSIILARPGLGKTRLLQDEVYRRSGPFLQAKKSAILPRNPEFAILVQAANLAGLREQDLIESVINAAGRFDSAAKVWLGERIRDGQCLVAIDSLDRVKNSAWLWAAILSFCQQHSKGKLLLSARIAGDPNLQKILREYVIQPFSNAQFLQALEAWLPEHARARQALVELGYRRPRLSLDLRWPLLLGFACELAREHLDDISAEVFASWASRTDLFERYVEHRIGEWLRVQGLQADDAFTLADLTRESAERVAYACVDTGRESWSARTLRHFFERSGWSRSEKRDPLKLFCDMGLLVQNKSRMTSSFSWCHTTVAEYLAARSLAKSPDEPNWDLIERKSWDPDWQELIPFLAAEFNNGPPNPGTRHLCTLLEKLIGPAEIGDFLRLPSPVSGAGLEEFLTEAKVPSPGAFREGTITKVFLSELGTDVLHHRLPLAALCLGEISKRGDEPNQRLDDLRNTIITRTYLFWRWAHRQHIPFLFLNLQEAMRTVCHVGEGALTESRKEDWPLFSLDDGGPDTLVDWTKGQRWPDWIEKLLDRSDDGGVNLKEVKSLLALMKTYGAGVGTLYGKLADKLHQKLVAMLDTTDAEARVRALKVIAAFPDTHKADVLAKLKGLLRSGDEERIIGSLWTLDSMGAAADREFRDDVLECCTNPKNGPELRIVALNVLPSIVWKVDSKARSDIMDRLLEIWMQDKWDQPNLLQRPFISQFVKKGEAWEVNGWLENRDSREIRFQAFYALVRLARSDDRLAFLEGRIEHPTHLDAGFFDWLKRKAADRPSDFTGTETEIERIAELGCRFDGIGASFGARQN